MIHTLLAAVALGVIPMPISTTMHINESDYPLKALRNHETGMTRAEVVVAPDGSVLRCDIISSSGSRTLDNKACLLATIRFRFEPGKDEAGISIAGVRRLDLNWAITDMRLRYVSWTDMTLSVDHLPQMTRPPVATLRIIINTSGHVESCEVDDTSGSKQLDRLACASAIASTVTPIRDGTGLSVRGIRNLVIAFTEVAVQPIPR